jgi:excisionase family DNA binding protein
MGIETIKRVTLTEREMCQKLGISRITAYRLRETGKISYLRIGRRIAYLESHIIQYIESVEIQAQSANQ